LCLLIKIWHHLYTHQGEVIIQYHDALSIYRMASGSQEHIDREIDSLDIPTYMTRGKG
jgi:hypothetical protein